MNKLFGLMMASALAVGASSAMADDQAQQQGQTGAQQGQTGAQQGQTGKQGMQGKAPAQTQAQKQAAAGLHEVNGHIVDIDKSKGNVKVQTDQGQLEFLFPPASLQGLNQGDAVRLQVAIRPALKTQQKEQKQQQKNEQK